VNALDRLLVGALLLAGLLAGGWYALGHYSAARYQAGYDAAVAAGEEARHSAGVAAIAIESGLRAQLLERDASAFKKEQEYASTLEAAQRRVRAGTDRLRCPAAGAVQPATAPDDRPAAGAPTVDGGGSDLVPEAASDVLGYGAAIASLVSRYAEVVEQHEDCRAVNAK
jgi:hypothetical protein